MAGYRAAHVFGGEGKGVKLLCHPISGFVCLFGSCVGEWVR